VQAGETVRSVAASFDVSVSAVVKWSQRYRASGSVAPGKMGGHRPVLLAVHREFVHARFAAEPELTLRGLQRELAAHGVKASYGAIWSFVHGEGLSFKKNRAGQRAGAARRRPAATALEGASGEARSPPPGLRG
jgi:putative transposase